VTWDLFQHVRNVLTYLINCKRKSPDASHRSSRRAGHRHQGKPSDYCRSGIKIDRQHVKVCPHEVRRASIAALSRMKPVKHCTYARKEARHVVSEREMLRPTRSIVGVVVVEAEPYASLHVPKWRTCCAATPLRSPHLEDGEVANLRPLEICTASKPQEELHV